MLVSVSVLVSVLALVSVGLKASIRSIRLIVLHFQWYRHMVRLNNCIRVRVLLDDCQSDFCSWIVVAAMVVVMAMAMAMINTNFS